MDINQRLENWARFSRTSSFTPASCRSLESKYKSPQCWEMPNINLPYDLKDALKVEHGLVSLPRKNMDIIVYSYVKQNRSFDAFCGKNKIKGTKLVSKSEMFNIELNRSIDMLQNILANSIS